MKCICGVIVSMHLWVEDGSGQTKDYEIGICCFSPKHAALRSQISDWLGQSQDYVSEWSAKCQPVDFVLVS